jgi:hypothetical protein
LVFAEQTTAQAGENWLHQLTTDLLRFQTKPTGIDKTAEPKIKPPKVIANRQRGGARIPAIKADNERAKLVNTILSALTIDRPCTPTRRNG